MGKTAVVVDPEYLKHFPGEDHPERPDRIQLLLKLAGGLSQQKFQLLPPRAASRADIEHTHGADHVRLVASTSSVNRYALDGDTITCRDRKSTRLNSSHGSISYAVFCLKKKKLP